jgi:hypothetical protein
MATIYLIINQKKKEINSNWDEYRCKPYIIPFAGLLGKDTLKNYHYCSWSIIRAFFVQLTKPLTLVSGIIFKNMSNMRDTLNNIRRYIYSVRKFIMNYIEDLMSRLEDFTATLRYTLIKVNTVLQKNNAVLQVFKNMGQVMAYMLLWIRNIIRPIIISIIMWGIAMSWILWWIFPAFSAIMGTLAAGAGLVYVCFSPDTKVIMADGTRKIISELMIGEQLYGYNNYVEGIVKSKLNRNNLYKINEIIVTGDHPVFYRGKWIKARQHPFSKKTVTNKFKYMYCLITSERLIYTNNDIFTDYIETDKHTLYNKNLILNKLNKSVGNMAIEENVVLSGFGASESITMYNNTAKRIDEVLIGDMLLNGDIVMAVSEFVPPPNTNIYLYDGIIVSGGQIVHEDNEWICVCDSKKATQYEKPIHRLFNIITTSNTIDFKGIQFRDFMETSDIETNDLIDSVNLETINKIQKENLHI